MAKVAALGSAEFIVGFQLAGIKDTFESGRDIMEKIKPLSINASQEGLRKMIIKSVGVDLWK